MTIKIFFFRISIFFLWNITEKLFLFKAEIDNRFASKSNTYNTSVITIDWSFKSILISSISWVFRTSSLIIVIVLLIVHLWMKIDSSEVICLLTFESMIHFRGESTRLSMIIQISSESFFFCVVLAFSVDLSNRLLFDFFFFWLTDFFSGASSWLFFFVYFLTYFFFIDN